MFNRFFLCDTILVSKRSPHVSGIWEIIFFFPLNVSKLGTFNTTSLNVTDIPDVEESSILMLIFYRNNTGYDLWEEVSGSSFFTVAAQHRALVEGSALAALSGSHALIAIPKPSSALLPASFWGSSQGYILATSMKTWKDWQDAHFLGAIHQFAPAAGCDATTFQP